MPKSLFLVPGFGAQGGSAKDVLSCFDSNGLGAVVSASRSIIFAHESSAGKNCSKKEYRHAVQAAVTLMKNSIYNELQTGFSSLCY